MHKLKQLNNKHTRGQAIIEYILILIVGVFIVLGLSAQFSEPFGDFIDELFSSSGGYYACLFETASLPGNPHPDCNYSSFTEGSYDWDVNISGGGSYYSSGGGFSPSPNSFSPSNSTSSGSQYISTPYTNTNSNTSFNSSPSVRDWGNPNSKFTGGSSSYSSQGGSRSFSANRNSGSTGFSREGSSGGSIDDIGANRNKRFKTKSKLTSGSNNLFADSSGRGNKGIISQGNLFKEQQNQQNRQTPFSAGSINKSSGARDPKTTAFIMKDPPKKTEDTADDEPFSFGKFIKYIMLGLILLTILFFVGGKAMEISENLKAA